MTSLRTARAATVLALVGAAVAAAAGATTYAERLGWPEGTRAVILHVDDAGMSHQSNVGTIRALTEGVASSVSVMMPCSWVPEFVGFLKSHPTVDAGLHLTLTSEWERYRWGPLRGRPDVPGLVDPEGCLWRTVEQVVSHATPDEVEAEIRAQLERARDMGFEPTHLDSHMGTLFATPAFLERYIRVGVEERIPVMLPAGHNTLLRRQFHEEAVAEAKRRGTWREGQPVALPASLEQAGVVGEQVWAAGLPVLDDLHNTSYGWRPAPGEEASDEALTNLKVARYSEALRELRPGVTMIIMHCADADQHFAHISDSGPTRRGDMLAMLDPRLREVIVEEGLVVTTFRELMERRRAVD